MHLGDLYHRECILAWAGTLGCDRMSPRAQKDWFRHGTWTEADWQEFEATLSRARQVGQATAHGGTERHRKDQGDRTCPSRAMGQHRARVQVCSGGSAWESNPKPLNGVTRRRRTPIRRFARQNSALTAGSISSPVLGTTRRCASVDGGAVKVIHLAA